LSSASSFLNSRNSDFIALYLAERSSKTRKIRSFFKASCWLLSREYSKEAQNNNNIITTFKLILLKNNQSWRHSCGMPLHTPRGSTHLNQVKQLYPLHGAPSMQLTTIRCPQSSVPGLSVTQS
jgi:hypothetical protein